MAFADACSRPEATAIEVTPPDGARTYLIGGNWKSNGTVESAEKLIKTFNEGYPIPTNAEVVIAAPFIHIPLLLMSLRKDIQVAAQNCSLTGTGAYTGEVTASQLKDMGVTWVILGHSERREGFGMAGEDSELVAKKTKMAISEGLKVMFCIGEKKEDREAGKTMDVCISQLKPLVDTISKEEWANISIAYEPVWAIGTGLCATAEMAQATQSEIRTWISENVGADVAAAVRIQYGGSMKCATAAELLAQPDIDGGLIGGASLNDSFCRIWRATPSP